MIDLQSALDFQVDTVSWVLLAVLCGSALLAILARFMPIIRVVKTARAQANVAGHISYKEGEKVPKASVVVYSIVNEDVLTDYLEALMNQDYPDFEVVLINEGGYEVTYSLSERLMARWPERLYVTFIPPESHNLSRRKLALTIGLKAAKGDVVITTTSNCLIPSRSWLSLMMQPFCAGGRTDVVLGYAHINFDNLRGPRKWYREFDATLTACQWLGAAIHHYPYRGDGFNLAYRKYLFFEQKGYSKTIHLVNGDDDLFVNEISTRRNTDVMIAPESILTYDWGEAGNRIMADMKERYQFTAGMLPKMPFLRAGFGSAMQWVATVAGIASAVWSWPDIVPLGVAVAMLTLLNISEILLYRKAARALGSVCLWWAVPIFLLWHPIGNFLFKWSHRHHKKKNFTFT